MFLPTFADSETERRAHLLSLILMILLPSITLLTIVILLLKGFSSVLFLICLTMLVVLFGLLGLLRAGLVIPTSVGLLIMLGVANVVGSSAPEFANIQGAYTAYGLSNGIILLLAAFLVAWWSSIPAAILLLLGQQIAALLGLTTVGTGAIEVLVLITFGLFVSLFARSLQFTLQHARKQEAVAQESATRAVELNSELEARLRDTNILLDQERQLRDTISKLSVPVQEVGERVLFAPLIGHIDGVRGQQITDTVLNKLHSSRAHTIIVDVQGVSTIDTNVARLLDQLIQAIQLLGARVILTGISAEMATTITQLGITFRNVELYPSVSSALQATTARSGSSVYRPSFS